MNLVYIDIETTGLDPHLHQVWEIAYAIDTGPVRTYQVRHSLDHADPEALTINRYMDRFTGGHDRAVEAEIQCDLQGATIVGFNPAFDATFLRARWGIAPWHHRTLDVSTYAMGVLNLDHIPRTDELVQLLGINHRGAHTAAGDVRASRDVHTALRRIARLHQEGRR